MQDTAPIRPGEEVNVAALSEYLQGKIADAEQGVGIEQFSGGHSNLTYLLRIGGKEYVLRRPPLGRVAPRAHDMAREYRLLKAIGPHFPAAPTVHVLCEDAAVLGAPFYVMERRRGLVLRRESPPEYARQPAFGEHASRAFIDCLADLHAIDIFRHKLDALGKPDGFLERQVQGWSQRWQRATTEALPEMERLSQWLLANIPASPSPTLVHNDFKLDNMMLDWQNPGRVVAVLDWEMSSVGDPLVDVGIVLCYWPEASDPPMRREAISPITTLPGWFSRRQLLDRYAVRTGRDLRNLRYYEVFGIFKLAVVLQQIYYRYHMGQTRDERFRAFPARIRGLAEAAVLAQEAQP